VRKEIIQMVNQRRNEKEKEKERERERERERASERNIKNKMRARGERQSTGGAENEIRILTFFHNGHEKL
jgi:hypothetical protein